MGFLMLPHSLTNFEIQKYYQNETRFNGVFSRNNLAEKIKDEAYVINLDEYASIGTHWVALFYKRNEIVYLIVLLLNMFLKKLKNLSGLKTSKLKFVKCKENNQSCVVTFAFYS